MIDKSYVDNILLQYLKDVGRVYGDAKVHAVHIDQAFSHLPVLDVYINNYEGGLNNYTVGVSQLKEYIDTHTSNLSIHGFLHFYGIEMPSSKRKLQYIYTKDSFKINDLPGTNPTGVTFSEYELQDPETDTKPIDPKAKAGNQKLSFHEMPILTLASIAKPFADGAKKYGLKNFYDFESYVSVYLSALKRHLMLFEAGQDNTSDSGVHHVDSMIAGLMVMREKMLVGKLVDDRKILDNDTIRKLEEMLSNG